MLRKVGKTTLRKVRRYLRSPTWVGEVPEVAYIGLFSAPIRLSDSTLHRCRRESCYSGEYYLYVHYYNSKNRAYSGLALIVVMEGCQMNIEIMLACMANCGQSFPGPSKVLNFYYCFFSVD